MEENKDIDNLFKSAIEPYEMEPTDNVWTSLNGELAKKSVIGQTGFRKIGNGLKYLSISLALLILSYGTYKVLSPSQDAESKNNSAQVAAESAANEKVAANVSATDKRVKEFLGTSDGNDSKNALSSENANAGTATQTNSHLPDSKNTDLTPASVANRSAGKNNGSITHSNTIAGASSVGNSHATSSTSAKSGAIKSSLTSENIPSKQRIRIAAGNAFEKGESSAKNKSETDVSAPSSLGSLSNATSEHGAAQSASTLNASGDNAADNELPNTTDEKENTPAVAMAENTPKAAPLDPMASDIAIKDPVVLASLASKMAKRFSVDVFYAPEMTDRTGEITGSQSIATTMTEKFSASYNTGTLLSYDLSDHFSVSLGCTYSTLSYSTSVSTSYEVPPLDSSSGGQNHNVGHIPHGSHGNQSDSDLSHHFKDPNYFQYYFSSSDNNELNYNNGCGTVHLQGIPAIPAPPASSRPGDEVYFITNTSLTLQYINVPLTVRYKLSNRLFDYYVDAGVSADFLIGKMATVNIADAYIETTSDIDGLAKTSYSYLFGLGMQYHFYKGFGIFAEPGIRGSITPINENGADKYYPYHVGVKAGISIRF